MEREILRILLFGLYLRTVFISKGSLKLATLRLEIQWLAYFPMISSNLSGNTSFCHHLFLNLLLSSTLHPIANLVDTGNIVDLRLSLIFLNFLDNCFVLVSQGIKGQVIFATFNFVILCSFLTSIFEPALLFERVKINITITTSYLLLLAHSFVVQCLWCECALGDLFLLKL